MKKIILAFLGLTLLTVFPACEDTVDQLEDAPLAPTEVFDVDVFIQNIANSLDNNVVGYAYSISFEGTQVRSGAWGNAIAAWDNANNGPQAHHENKRQDLASVSKIITALTALRLMQDNNIFPDDEVNAYLPVSWVRGNNVHTMSFLEFMTHTAGLPSNAGISHQSIRNVVTGSNSYTAGNYLYSNSNYAMMRVLIAALYDPVQMTLMATQINVGANTEEDLEDLISELYIDAVNEIVFSKAGIPFTEPTINSLSSIDVWNYNFNNQSVGGWVLGDATDFVGSAGWRLSATELNSILATLKYTDDILNETYRQYMNTNSMGWHPASTTDVTGGQSYGHGGFHNEDVWVNNGGLSFTRGCFTACILFPNNYEIAIVCNSIGGTGNMESVVIPAYNNAWVNP